MSQTAIWRVFSSGLSVTCTSVQRRRHDWRLVLDLGNCESGKPLFEKMGGFIVKQYSFMTWRGPDYAKLLPRCLAGAFRLKRPHPAVTPEVASRFGTPPPDAFTIAPALVQPTSRGSVRLASGNFQDAAVIDGNYLLKWSRMNTYKKTWGGRWTSALILLRSRRIVP